MSSEAIEAAAYDAADRTIDAIEQRKDLVFNGMFDPEIREIAQAVLDAVKAIIRADERAKVTEDIAEDILAQWDNYEPEWAEALRNLAAIARRHA